MRERIGAEEMRAAPEVAPRARTPLPPRRPRRWMAWAGAAAAACAAHALFVLLRPPREAAGPAPGGLAQAPAARPAPAAPPRVMAERAPAPTPSPVEEPAPAAPPDADLAEASEDELSLALELSQLGDEDVQKTVSDLDLIQNLDALERLDALDPGNRG